MQTRLGKLIALIPAFVRLEYALLNASAPCGDVRWSVGGLREQERSGHQIARRAEGGEYKESVRQRM